MSKILYVGRGQGRSMHPVINEGDKLFIEKVKFSNIRIGDIVVFYNRRNLIGHRVIKLTGDKIITKGDNVTYFDRPLKSYEILGKIVSVDGKYGKINFQSSLSSVLSNYFLFYSLSTYYIPNLLRLFLIKILRGRKILMILLSRTNFSKRNPIWKKK